MTWQRASSESMCSKRRNTEGMQYGSYMLKASAAPQMGCSAASSTPISEKLSSTATPLSNTGMLLRQESGGRNEKGCSKVQLTLAGGDRMCVLLSGDKMRVLLSGDRMCVLLSGERMCVLLSGDRMCVLLSGDRIGDRMCVLLSGDRMCVLLSGDRMCVLLSVDRMCVLLSGDKMCVLLSGDRMCVLLSGDRRRAAIEYASSWAQRGGYASSKSTNAGQGCKQGAFMTVGLGRVPSRPWKSQSRN
eukprot:1160638-Pelagomonas_calceolata.AAC.2